MKRFLFLIGWIHGSDTAEGMGVETKLRRYSDLLPQFKKGNKNVFAVEVRAPNEDMACTIGYREAFFADYTSFDSVSNIIPLKDDYKYPAKCHIAKTVVMEMFTSNPS
jgi:hypothetical protein